MLYYNNRRFFSLIMFVLLSTNPMLTANAETPSSHSSRSIHVNGIGKVLVLPDKADLTLSVEIQAKTAEAAREQAAATMENLIKAVKNLDIANKDIQTRSVSLYPSYSPDTVNKISGYQLSNQVAVCVRDINKTSEIIDAAVKGGGNSTRVQGVSFAIENPESALSKAREKAFANAKEKAGQYAKLAGVNLGSPLHISEGNDVSAMPMPYGEIRMMSAKSASSSTPVLLGEQEVSVTVDVIFDIQ